MTVVRSRPLAIIGRGSMFCCAGSGVKNRKHGRNLVVLGCLLTALVVTSVALLALSPPPLTQDAAVLLALDARDPVASIFETHSPFQPARWRHILIHHSRSARAMQPPPGQQDHFLIGNGRGLADGELQYGLAWLQQRPALLNGAPLKGDCITICLVGDFERAAPTAVQMRRLEQLVRALRGRCSLSADQVLFDSASGGPGGIGRHFPVTSFVQQLRP